MLPNHLKNFSRVAVSYMDSPVVREALPDEISRMWQAIINDEIEKYKVPPAADPEYIKDFAHHPPSDVVFWTIGGKSLLEFNPKPRVCHLYSVWVDPDCRGRHYGQILVRKAIDHWKMFYRDRPLELTVYQDNVPAIKLYEKLGFIRTGDVNKHGAPEWVYKMESVS